MPSTQVQIRGYLDAITVNSGDNITLSPDPAYPLAGTDDTIQAASGADLTTDTLSWEGQSIAGTVYSGDTDQYGRTYTLNGTTLTVSTSTDTLTVNGFQNGDFGLTIGADFEGDQVSLSGYYPNLVPADLGTYGTATVGPGITFPSIAVLVINQPPGTYTVDGSVDFNGNQITISYPASEEGITFGTAPFDGFVFTVLSPDAPAITGVSILETNTSLTSADLTFTANTIVENGSGVTLPSNAPGSINLSVSFAGSPPDPFFIDDLTTNAQTVAAGMPYTGPVAGLPEQYIYTGSDNLNVAPVVANTFVHTGGGEDAIDVSHVGGTNVLDGGTNSNFLVAGTGPGSFDTFFVDDRSPSADIWSTVANFHTDDAATVFGITQSGFNTSWVDGQGAAGYTGLTLHVTAPGVPTASLTLSGFTTAALTNGQLTTGYGTENDGTPYLYVHAN